MSLLSTDCKIVEQHDTVRSTLLGEQIRVLLFKGHERLRLFAAKHSVRSLRTTVPARRSDRHELHCQIHHQRQHKQQENKRKNALRRRRAAKHIDEMPIPTMTMTMTTTKRMKPRQQRARRTKNSKAVIWRTKR